MKNTCGPSAEAHLNWNICGNFVYKYMNQPTVNMSNLTDGEGRTQLSASDWHEKYWTQGKIGFHQPEGNP